MKTPVKPTKDGISISIYVQPGARKSEWDGVVGEELKLRIAARPVDGQANKEVCLFLSRYFGVAKGAVSIIQGETSRHKVVAVLGNAQAMLHKLTGSKILD